MRDFVVELRQRLVPEVKNLTVRGINDGSQPFVLWKNRQFVANRMRYAGGASKISAPTSLNLDGAAARALAVPDDAADRRAVRGDVRRFCRTFPDTFFVSERARVYLDPKKEKGNAGRLLSAGFHSMTGYFRDDAPLYELMLDDAGPARARRALAGVRFHHRRPDAAVHELPLVRARRAPRFMRRPEFDFARAEDKDATSEAKIERLAEVYLAKARTDRGERRRRSRRSRTISAIISAEHPPGRAGPAGGGAEPPRGPADVRRAGLPPAAVAGGARRRRRVLPRRCASQDGLSHEDAVRDTVVSVLMSPHFCYRVDLPGAGAAIRPLSDYALASRLSYFLWSSMPDDELLAHAAAGDLHQPEVLVAQARRMLRDDRVRGLATEFAGNWLDFRRFEEHNSVDRERFPSFNDELRRAMFEEPIRFFVDLVRNDRSVLEFLDGEPHVRQPGPGPALRHARCPAVGPDEWVRVDDATAIRARRAAADGGLPDQELAGPADQPGQARLLGRPPAARREHPRAAAERPRAAQATRPSSAS